MLKNISNLGSVLSKTQQKQISGGKLAPGDRCNFIFLCPIGEICRYGNNEGTIGICEYA